MPQKETHREVLKNRTFRLSEYDFELLKKNAQNSHFNTTTAYLNWLINQNVIRK